MSLTFGPTAVEPAYSFLGNNWETFLAEYIQDNKTLYSANAFRWAVQYLYVRSLQVHPEHLTAGRLQRASAVLATYAARYPIELRHSAYHAITETPGLTTGLGRTRAETYVPQ
jgi:hypothetical protein